MRTVKSQMHAPAFNYTLRMHREQLMSDEISFVIRRARFRGSEGPVNEVRDNAGGKLREWTAARERIQVIIAAVHVADSGVCICLWVCLFSSNIENAGYVCRFVLA